MGPRVSRGRRTLKSPVGCDMVAAQLGRFAQVVEDVRNIVTLGRVYASRSGESQLYVQGCRMRIW